jgi:hypothetical protein
MASTQETGIIKSDGIGRVRYSQAYKDEVVAAYRASGMSAAAFAKHCGVKYPTFVSWVAKGKTESSPRGGDEGGQRFILAQIGGSQAEVPLKVELPGGVLVHVSNPDQLVLLAELLKAIR